MAKKDRYKWKLGEVIDQKTGEIYIHEQHAYWNYRHKMKENKELIIKNMTKKEMNELADMIVDKLLTTYIREQATWYTSSTMDDIYRQFKQTPKKHRTKKQTTESELLGELAKLMTQLNFHQEREEYEVCAEIKKEIDDVNDKLSKL